MKGLMMDYPLTLTHFFERSRRLLPGQAGGDPCAGPAALSLHLRRLRRPGAAGWRGPCPALGVGPGDRVGTFAWNSHRHLELYWAAPLLGLCSTP